MQSAGDTPHSLGYDVAVDAAGNSYITGTFKDTATFGPFTLTSAGDFGIFVAKISLAGLCSPGFFSKDGFEHCDPCPPGTFSGVEGATSCVDCGDCDDGDLCTDDSCDAAIGCANEPIPGCTDAIPTASGWGLITFTLLLLAAGKVCFSRRSASPT